MNFHDKTVLVTGAGAGIGRSIAKAFLSVRCSEFRGYQRSGTVLNPDFIGKR